MRSKSLNGCWSVSWDGHSQGTATLPSTMSRTTNGKAIILDRGTRDQSSIADRGHSSTSQRFKMRANVVGRVWRVDTGPMSTSRTSGTLTGHGVLW